MRRPPNRGIALLRNSWRQLTSMRTALVLLFLLALAAIPGSVLPQRSVNIEDVNGYFAEHPDLAPVLDRLWAFDVFASPWFSAIYLLLFTSLVGCVVPRLADHVRALRSVPPPAPRRLNRLPQHADGLVVDGGPQALAAALRRRRWRVAVRGDTVSAEKGYLKETGNLLFHFSLVGVLVGVAVGSWYGWHGNRLLVAGPERAFCTSVQQFDEHGLGPRVSPGDLAPFCLELTDFEASFLDNGQPVSFAAHGVVSGPAAPRPGPVEFSVNSPLRLDGANVYLLGHGYAPVLRYTDREGKAQTTVAPFLPSDNLLTSEGVAAFPDVNGLDRTLQVAFDGLYLPTAPEDPPFVRSQHPEERSPALVLVAYRGNLGLDAGIPQSVYELNRRQIENGHLAQVGDAKLLRVGEVWTLDDGTTLEFLGTERWVALSVRYDPGEPIVLVSVVLLLVGLVLTLTGRRRRVWFRPVGAGDAGGADGEVYEAGGLPRGDYPGFAEEFAALVRDVTDARDARDAQEVGRAG
ncbi:MAG: cytochrome c biogenesis protein ResB [Micromonosporaceae bacterium]